ncbi:hypothetical protein [Streptomyces mirabilis]
MADREGCRTPARPAQRSTGAPVVGPLADAPTNQHPFQFQEIKHT